MNISGLDVLVNNAARIYFPDSNETYEKQARDTIETNYYGNKWVYEIKFPLFSYVSLVKISNIFMYKHIHIVF